MSTSRDNDADPPSTSRTTRSNAPRPPQDTSTALPASTELPPENPKVPRALLDEIRARLSTAQAANKKLSQAQYKDIFILLDTLRTALDDKEVLTSSLNAFKSDLLVEIQSTLATRTSPTPSYSAAAASPLHTPSASVPVPAPPHHEDQRVRHRA
ncbi:hypothetical protein K438DRAFT_1768939 [Mycena galopus ATCC 62051]|nr:hypothetical protein K438DRAFT_1768939 [Mycena galopus ATCC 62051]